MKFLIVNTDYPEFLRWLYASHPGLGALPYREQLRVRDESLFGVANFYSNNLQALGHEAWQIHANNAFIQRAWAHEHGVDIECSDTLRQQRGGVLQRARAALADTPVRYLKPLVSSVLRSLDRLPRWLYGVLVAQIRYYRPDIVLNQDMGAIDCHVLREVTPSVRLFVGQIAAPVPTWQDLRCYDLVVSSLPNLVRWFREQGLRATLNRLAFEPRILKALSPWNGRQADVTFIGSLSQFHRGRVKWLEYLCRRLNVDIWGEGVNGLPRHSAIRRHYQGKAWGLEMYQILERSKVALNHHLDLAGPHANNMRLFEVTGVGTLLTTDWKQDLDQLFVAGREVVAYRSPEECAGLIEHYLAHDEEREAIARAGHARTLREHTYAQRMQELVAVVRRYMT